MTKIVNQVSHIEDLLKNHSWDFICQSFEKTIAMAKPNDFIYCDPPYIGRYSDYYDSWDDRSELALHGALIESGAKFMLSTWDSSEYRENTHIAAIWYDCERTTLQHFYYLGAKEKNRKPVTEALLTNYHIPGDQNKPQENIPGKAT